jgi:type IV pilus assembly protein PilA
LTSGEHCHPDGISIADLSPASLDADVTRRFSSTKEKYMKRIQQGFTLIELMIVVAIVGILAAIALPAYQDYIVRSKMSEVEAAVAACKTSVAEYVASHGSKPLNNTAAGCSKATTQYVDGAGSAGFDGTKISYKSKIPNGSNGDIVCTLSLTPSAPTSDAIIASWSGSFTAGSNCASKYIPSTFRG